MAMAGEQLDENQILPAGCGYAFGGTDERRTAGQEARLNMLEFIKPLPGQTATEKISRKDAKIYLSVPASELILPGAAAG
jgi:hypothetical protein